MLVRASNRSGSFRYPAFAIFALVVATTALACVLDDVGSLMAVVGAACATPLMTIFPPAMLLRCAPDRKALALGGSPHVIMCALGCLATVAGLPVSVLDWGSPTDEDPAADAGGARFASRLSSAF